jgi:hypothetical protein
MFGDLNLKLFPVPRRRQKSEIGLKKRIRKQNVTKNCKHLNNIEMRITGKQFKFLRWIFLGSEVVGGFSIHSWFHFSLYNFACKNKMQYCIFLLIFFLILFRDMTVSLQFCWKRNQKMAHEAFTKCRACRIYQKNQRVSTASFHVFHHYLIHRPQAA